MGCLACTQTLDLRKATISVWFRIPQATADGIESSSGAEFDVFQGKIPIIALGRQHEGTVTDFEDTIVGYLLRFQPVPQAVRSNRPVSSRSAPMAPSFIGVDKEGYLCVHLQTGDVGTSSQTTFNLSKFEQEFRDPPGFWFTSLTYANDTASTLQAPDALGNAGLPSGSIDPSENGFKVSFDAWHHLLLSWDLGDGNAAHGYWWADSAAGVSPPQYDDKHAFVDGYSTMYCAVDDVNKSGDVLPGMRYPGMPANATISHGAYSVAGSNSFVGPAHSDITNEQVGGPSSAPTYKVDFANGVQADGVFIPAELQYDITFARNDGPGAVTEPVRPIKRVEMADLQIFAGVTMDTGDVNNRRAFIAEEIKENRPTGFLIPANPEAARDLMRKRPEVLLRGQGNWIEGKNTGSLGMEIGTDGQGEIIPSGQFTKTGTIVKYEPDPKITRGTTLRSGPPRIRMTTGPTPETLNARL
jgi:hypothetical protein